MSAWGVNVGRGLSNVVTSGIDIYFNTKNNNQKQIKNIVNKSITINLNKNLCDVDFNQSIWDLVRFSNYMLIHLAIVISFSWVTLCLLLKVFNISLPFSYWVITGITIFYCCYVIALVRDYCKTELKYRKKFKRVLLDSNFVEEWKAEYLNLENLTWFNLIYAKAHGLLSEDEFKIRKDLIPEQNIERSGGNFLMLVELRNELKISDEQFITIKNYFINDPSYGADKSILRELQKIGILTKEEVATKQAKMRKCYLSIKFKQCSFGALCGMIAFVLGYVVEMRLHELHTKHSHANAHIVESYSVSK